jgi:hypothetical protein
MEEDIKIGSLVKIKFDKAYKDVYSNEYTHLPAMGIVTGFGEFDGKKTAIIDWMPVKDKNLNMATAVYYLDKAQEFHKEVFITSLKLWESYFEGVVRRKKKVLYNAQ